MRLAVSHLSLSRFKRCTPVAHDHTMLGKAHHFGSWGHPVETLSAAHIRTISKQGEGLYVAGPTISKPS
jgi:hypothetical protein